VTSSWSFILQLLKSVFGLLNKQVNTINFSVIIRALAIHPQSLNAHRLTYKVKAWMSLKIQSSVVTISNRQ